MKAINISVDCFYYVTHNHIKLTQLFDTTNTFDDYNLIYKDITNITVLNCESILKI